MNTYTSRPSPLSVRLAPELRARVESHALADRRTVTSVVVVALEEYLERRDKTESRRARRATAGAKGAKTNG